MKQRPTKYKGVVVSKVFLNQITCDVTIKLINPDEIEFEPGQFVSVEVGENTFRSYSISSDESLNNSIKLLVSVGHKGIGSNFFREIEIGEELSFIGPAGRYVLPNKLDHNIVFIATGSGIAPFESMLQRLVNKEQDKNITIFYGIRNENLIIKEMFLKQCKDTLPTLEYYYCLSQPINFQDRDHIRIGRVTTVLTSPEFYKHLFLKNTQFFLCGNPTMVEEMNRILLDNNIKGDKIFYEKFTTTLK